VTEAAETDSVLLDVDGDGVATFTLNRPDQRNGWSPAMENRYFDLLAEADRDPSVRAAVLTGAGTSFCPGLDMTRLKSIAGQRLDVTDRRPQYSPRAFRKPLVAAINGACAGIGLVQALMCDVRFAAQGARFSTAFARRGLGAEYNLAWVLPRLIGVESALDLLLSARTFDAEEAQRLGVVSRVVDPEAVLDAARAYARDLARNCSPTAMATIRHQVYADLDSGFEAAMRRSARVMDTLATGPDMREGIASFVERRTPSFPPLPDDFDPEAVTGAQTPGARQTLTQALT
jgi:enoyl-CoA hydratase/carnithine racemase